VLALHPQIIGRPSRLLMLDRFLQFVQALDGVHVGTCEEIASLVPETAVAGRTGAEYP
jgi:peptidoglycan-N-acetylglucosamine deacetylase